MPECVFLFGYGPGWDAWWDVGGGGMLEQGEAFYDTNGTVVLSRCRRHNFAFHSPLFTPYRRPRTYPNISEMADEATPSCAPPADAASSFSSARSSMASAAEPAVLPLSAGSSLPPPPFFFFGPSFDGGGGPDERLEIAAGARGRYRRHLNGAARKGAPQGRAAARRAAGVAAAAARRAAA